MTLAARSWLVAMANLLAGVILKYVSLRFAVDGWRKAQLIFRGPLVDTERAHAPRYVKTIALHIAALFNQVISSLHFLSLCGSHSDHVFRDTLAH